MAEQIKINDGSKVYEIVNERGEHVCDLKLNPSDTGIIARLDSVINALNGFKPSSEENNETIIEMDGILVDKVSELFNCDASETLFKNCKPLSMLDNGNLYIVEVLEAITPVIEKVTKARAAKVQKRMDKYTAQYNK